MTTNNTLRETDEQQLVVEYLELLKSQGKVRIFCALPNNLYTKSWSQKIKQKREGLRPGFPDLVIVFKNTVLFLEMKRKKGGVVSKDQWAFLTELADKNTKTAVAKGFDEAKALIDSILKGHNETI